MIFKIFNIVFYYRNFFNCPSNIPSEHFGVSGEIPDAKYSVLRNVLGEPSNNKFALIDLVKQDNIGVRPFIINNGFDIYLMLPNNGPLNGNQIIKKTNQPLLPPIA